MGTHHLRSRAVTEMALARDAAPDPVYTALAESNLGAYLANSGEYDAARVVIEPALRFAEEQSISVAVLTLLVSRALVLLGEGELTRGMDQLETLRREAGALRSHYFETAAALLVATVYGRIATGEGSKGSMGTIVRNPGFVLGSARRASQTARDALAHLSATSPATSKACGSRSSSSSPGSSSSGRKETRRESTSRRQSRSFSRSETGWA